MQMRLAYGKPQGDTYVEKGGFGNALRALISDQMASQMESAQEPMLESGAPNEKKM